MCVHSDFGTGAGSHATTELIYAPGIALGASLCRSCLAGGVLLCRGFPDAVRVNMDMLCGVFPILHSVPCAYTDHDKPVPPPVRVTNGSQHKGVLRVYARTASTMLQTSSILIIDQHPAIADLLEDILTEAGYTVATVRDDAAALVALAHDTPQLILLDVGHNGRRGIEVIEYLRAAGLAAVPIVAMTTAPHDVAPEFVPGAVECLSKPFEIGTLLDCIARYIQPAQPALLERSVHGRK
jgi:CheY-like chemotaxis protein